MIVTNTSRMDAISAIKDVIRLHSNKIFDTACELDKAMRGPDAVETFKAMLERLEKEIRETTIVVRIWRNLVEDFTAHLNSKEDQVYEEVKKQLAADRLRRFKNPTVGESFVDEPPAVRPKTPADAGIDLKPVFPPPGSTLEEIQKEAGEIIGSAGTMTLPGGEIALPGNEVRPFALPFMPPPKDIVDAVTIAETKAIDAASEREEPKPENEEGDDIPF